MLVYSAHITPRLQYIVNVFAQEIDIAPWALTTNIEEFNAATDAKINYSDCLANTNCIQIQPCKLLFEKGVSQQQINCTVQDGVKVFFQNESDTGFDIFAAAFYLVSRYEEYLPHPKDGHGRFSHENSFAYKEGFLQLPLVNIWIENFKKIIVSKFPNYRFRQKQFTFLPTYDIDIAWSYLHKGFFRTAGNLLKDFFTLHFSGFTQRSRVLSGMEKDPFDTFDWLNEIHAEYDLAPRYFFLVAESLSGYDKNISPHHPAMKQLIATISAKNKIGLHPSWNSNTDEKILQKEKKLLEKISGENITASRQHYLKFSFPHTFRALINAGITKDFSLGYSGDNGFRASLASPFTWYDLEKETETPLTIYPFCFMEGTSIFYKKQTPVQALEELKHLHNEVKKVNGFFCTLWHNSSLSNINEYKGWKNMYISFLRSAM